MAKYLKRFGTEEEYDSFAGSDKFVLPNVSFIESPTTPRKKLMFSPYIKPYDPSNGYEYVDLGLPSGLKWAKCNLGATEETDYGLYYQWGDVVGYSSSQVGSGEGKKYFSWSDYKYCNGSSYSLTKYNTSSSYGIVDNITVLEPSDDAASVNMGGSWRIPTKNEYTELINNTTNRWTIKGGAYGRIFTSKNNGNTLFFPAAGNCLNGGIGYINKDAGYWASTINPDINYSVNIMAFNSNSCYQSSDRRTYGLSVRGVFS